MRALHRKLGRELLGSAGVLLTVIAIIAVGTGCFIGLGSAVRILTLSQQSYYDDYRFADFWISVKKAPLTVVERLRQMDGVAVIEPRIVFDVILDVPDEPQPLTGRLLSTPAERYDQVLNGLCLVRGAAFSDDRDEEVILSEAFAVAHGLNPGDRIGLILNRKRESFIIAGTAISPEYVYMVRGEGDLVPDPKHFGILYVKEHYARDVLDFRDACNQIVGRMTPGADIDVETLLKRMERELDPYGVLATTPRERQASHRFLSDEIAGGRVSSTMIPAIFLSIAALALNVLMSRFAERQRTIIGTLKALGYSDRAVLGHFVGFGVVVGVVGGIAGGGIGIAMAAGMVEMYKGFFQFPTFVYELYPDLLLIGLLISIVFAVAGTAKGVWVVLRLQPAEAMRQKPPERGGASFLERLPWLWRRLGFRTHIALRALVRNRVRTLTGVLSTSLAAGMLLISFVMVDSIWYLVEFQFDRITHSDMDVGMRDESSIDAVWEAQSLPGVDYVEPLLGLPCDLRNGRHTRRLAITGLSPEHRLMTPMRTDFVPIDIPPEGIVMARKLAEILAVDAGDALELVPVRGRREPVRVHVASIVDSFLGLDCYADIGYLSRIVGESAAVNSLQVQVDPVERAALFRAIKNLPNAQGLSVRSDVKANIEGTFVSSMTATFGVIILFAGVIAFGSILNNALVEIGDRIRDISTFRVLGYRPWQVAAIFLRQTLVTYVLGIILAAPISYGLIRLMVQAYDTELFRMPAIITLRSVIVSALLSLLFVLLAQAVVYWQIRKLNWLEGIQVKE
ncbi:MAG: ABC transporter permease [Phycisphaerae bacterium]|nr:ABC transporter permease [Phycisphaerae bacterium]